MARRTRRDARVHEPETVLEPDSIYLQRWRDTTTVLYYMGAERRSLKCDSTLYALHSERGDLYPLLGGDCSFLADALELEQARAHFGLGCDNDGQPLFEEYARVCVAYMNDPDTIAEHARLWGQFPPGPPALPASFDEYVLRLYRLEKRAEPWACPWSAPQIVQPQDTGEQAPAMVETEPAPPRSAPKADRPAKRKGRGKTATRGERRSLVLDFYKARAQDRACPEYECDGTRSKTTMKSFCADRGIAQSTFKEWKSEFPDSEFEHELAEYERQLSRGIR